MVLFRHNLMRAEFLQSDTEEWNRQKSRDELGGGAGGGGVCLISFEQRFFFEFGCFLIFQSCLFCFGHNSLWFDGGGMDFDVEFHERNNHGLKIHFKKKWSLLVLPQILLRYLILIQVIIRSNILRHHFYSPKVIVMV